jgi:cell division inhibitor SulA
VLPGSDQQATVRPVQRSRRQFAPPCHALLTLARRPTIGWPPDLTVREHDRLRASAWSSGIAKDFLMKFLAARPVVFPGGL